MIHSRTTIAIPPGMTIREQLDNRKMSQKEFANRMDMSEKHISRLINGKVELSHDVALRLESVFGIPAKFWNSLEALYRENEARVLEELDMEYDEEIAKKMPYTKCAGFGWLTRTTKIKEKVINLRKFFEVANLKALEHLKVPGIVYRKASSSIPSDYALAMWAQKARIEARSIKTDPIDIKLLKQSIHKIRALSVTEPSCFENEITTLLAKCGIALVFLPHIKGSFLHGATFADGNHIVVGLTLRGCYADKFWFSLFHELGHIICGHISSITDDTESNEEDANIFAQNTLIPNIQYDEFIRRRNFSQNDITYFSSLIGIAPWIVLGRLQKENYVPYSYFSSLKVKYEFVD